MFQVQSRRALGKRLQREGHWHLQQVQEEGTHCEVLQKWQDAGSWKCCIDWGEARQSILQSCKLRAAVFDGKLLPLILTSDYLYTLRVSPSLCNFRPRGPSVDRLPGIARSGEGFTGGSTWLGAQALSRRTQSSGTKTLGHNNYQGVACLSKLEKVMTIVGGAGPGHCDTCSTEKGKRAPVNKKWGTRAAERLEIVNTDVQSGHHPIFLLPMRSPTQQWNHWLQQQKMLRRLRFFRH